MYKLIVCDLDETLLRLDRTISEKDIEAIKRAGEAGIKFVPATGRGFETVDGTLKELGLFGEKDQYVISYNGAAITENAGHKVLDFQPVPFDLANEIYKRGLGYDVCIHVYTENMVYINNLVQEEIAYLANRMEIREIDYKDIDFLRGSDIAKVLYMNTDFEYLKSIACELSDITGDLEVSYSSNRYIEFNKKGVDKGNALERLAALLNIPIEDTVAIGDNYNDLPMIRRAGLGACVGNAVDEVKKAAAYVSEKTCDESAVADILETNVFG